MCLFFFFKQKTAYEMRISDWSSDVCSSDLVVAANETVLTQSLGEPGTACRTKMGRSASRTRCEPQSQRSPTRQQEAIVSGLDQRRQRQAACRPSLPKRLADRPQTLIQLTQRRQKARKSVVEGERWARGGETGGRSSIK